MAQKERNMVSKATMARETKNKIEKWVAKEAGCPGIRMRPLPRSREQYKGSKVDRGVASAIEHGILQPQRQNKIF